MRASRFDWKKQHPTMATNKRKKQKTAVVANGNGGKDGGGGGKRYCTRSTSTTTVKVKQEQVVTISPTKQKDNDDALPTSIELSKVLCLIVETDHFSRVEAIFTLQKIYNWMHKKDANFLKHFYLQGGIIKVLDFLTVTMNDVNCTGDIRFDSIRQAARVIRCVAKAGVGAADNKDIILKILAFAVDSGGLDTLINASEEYNGGDDILQLTALADVWHALLSIYQQLPFEKDIIAKEKANALFETGIDVLSHFKLAVIDNISSNVLMIIFRTFRKIVVKNYVTKDFIQNNNCISKCLDVFKKNDGTWKDDKGDEHPARKAILFFKSCHYYGLLNGDSDYELIFGFFAFALKTFSTNKVIRDNGISFLNASFSFLYDIDILKQSGCLEALGSILGSNEIDADEKRIVSALIGRIGALP